jgi:hypothetical protein
MSTLKQAIKRQIDHSGTLLLKCSSALSDEEFFQVGSGGASMAWTLGHLTALQDWSVNRVFQNSEPKFSHEQREALKGGRELRKEDLQFISDRPAVEKSFSDQQYETIRCLDAFDVERWHEPTPSGCRFPFYGSLWEMLAVHNSWHLGAISVSIPRIADLTLTAPRYYTVDPQDG